MKESKELLDEDIEEKIDKYYDDREKFWGKISHWCWMNIGWKIREFKRSCRNLITWLPIIWKDRQWDSSYIFIILKKKIELVRDHHIEQKHYVGWEREVELMNICIKLIDRVDSEYYSTLAHDQIIAKYGKSEWRFTPVEDTAICKDCSEMHIDHENILNGKYTQEEYDVEFKRLVFDEAGKKHLKAKKLLFKILDERIERWWI